MTRRRCRTGSATARGTASRGRAAVRSGPVPCGPGRRDPRRWPRPRRPRPRRAWRAGRNRAGRGAGPAPRRAGESRAGDPRAWRPGASRPGRCCRSSCDLLGILDGMAERADHDGAAVEEPQALVGVVARLRAGVDQRPGPGEGIVPALLRALVEPAAAARVLLLEHPERAAVVAGGAVQGLLRFRVGLRDGLVEDRGVALPVLG